MGFQKDYLIVYFCCDETVCNANDPKKGKCEHAKVKPLVAGVLWEAMRSGAV